MQPPTTPTKGPAADKLLQTTDELSARWGLPLPKRAAQWSPSKVPLEQNVGEKVVARIRFLVFKNQIALDRALEAFEQKAAHTCQGWKVKPGADDDVLPRRNSRTSGPLAGGGFLRKLVADPRIVNDLMETLLDLLDRAADGVKRDQERAPYHDDSLSAIHSAQASSTGFALPSLPTDAKPKSFFGTTSAHLEEQQRKTRSLPYRHIKDEEGASNKSLRDEPFSSSDDFIPDHATLSIMEDITMIDSPHLSPTKLPSALAPDKLNLSDDEDFVTPPASPGIAASSSENLIDPELRTEAERDSFSFNFPQSDLIRSPQFASSKKRPFSETIKNSLPRKASRGETKMQSSTISDVGSWRSTTRLDDPFGKQRATASGLCRTDTHSLRHLLTSFNSVSSATNMTTPSSSAWSASRSYSTTPNTSFRSDSLVTSFNSNHNHIGHADELPKITASSDISESKTAIRSAPNTPRAKRKNTKLQRAATTSNAEAQSENAEPMEVDDSGLGRGQEVFSDLLDRLNVEKKFSTATLDDNGYWARQLRSLPLLSPIDLVVPSTVPFRQLYEVTRVSTSCKLSLDLFESCLDKVVDEYEKLWSALGSVVAKHNNFLPERSDLKAWEKAQGNFDEVTLTGDLDFSNNSDNESRSIFHLSLKPMKVEKSYRLARKFGSDRFCIIGIPGLDRPPARFKVSSTTMRAIIVDSLMHTDLVFLGRRWRAFYLRKPEKPERSKKTRSPHQNHYENTKQPVFFFARDGDGFGKNGAENEGNLRPKIELEELLNWFMPFKENLRQPCLKFFSRLALGVSGTTPTVQFESYEIVRTSDARADVPARRRLTPQSPEEQERILQSNAPVMNDGCARISKPAAQAIASQLKLTRLPSVFQGRIGGAKGLWMVDALDEAWPQSSRNFWIEITDSQQKFEKHQIDAIYPDPARVTFEVHSYSLPLTSAFLNFQFLPILVNQGVPKGVFERLIEEDLQIKMDELDAATENPLLLRAWNQGNQLVASVITRKQKHQMQGGLPHFLFERINWFIEHGFDPYNNMCLRGFLSKAFNKYCMTLQDRMKIGVGKSTNVFMLADPLAVLEENEIHLGFSSNFRDPKDTWDEVFLHDMDVLVARSPAYLSSDVQKVRAVFKSELLSYKDVVIFSSKGTRSLADKLSGGDYDGDRAWVCWEPAIVEPFQNAAVPPVPPLEFYDIQKSNVAVAEIIQNPDYVTMFLRNAFDFNLEANMLGKCSAYHESLCYWGTSIQDPKAIAIAALLGHLVDRAKSGIVFSESHWFRFLKRNEFPMKIDKPAYKDKESQRLRSHTLDKLVSIAQRITKQGLTQFHAKFAQVGTWDEDLGRLWSREVELAKSEQSTERAFTDLKASLDSIVDFWMLNARGHDEDARPIFRTSSPPLNFAAVVEKCRDDFLNLAPTCPSDTPQSSILWRWAHEWKDGRGGNWSLVKASALYHKQHRNNMSWHVAGIELGKIKAAAQGQGMSRVIVAPIYAAMKLDRKAVDRIQRRELQCEAEEWYDFEDVDEDEHEEEGYGVFEWDE